MDRSGERFDFEGSLTTLMFIKFISLKNPMQFLASGFFDVFHLTETKDTSLSYYHSFSSTS
jgi:hypothetical protein